MSYLNWRLVENTVKERTLDDSLLHTLEESKKIYKETKIFNQRLRKTRHNIRSFKRFLKLKKNVQRLCQDGYETDVDHILTLEEYKEIHQSKPPIRALLKLYAQQTRPKEYPSKGTKQSPIIDEKKSNLRIFKEGHEPEKETSLFNSKKSKSRSVESKLQKKRKTSNLLGEPDAISNDIPKDDNLKEGKYIDKVIKDIFSDNDDRRVIEYSSTSDSQRVGTLEIKADVKVENCLEEQTAGATQSDITDRSKAGSDLEVESEVSDTEKQNSCNVCTHITDDLDTYDGPSQEDIFATDDETIDAEQRFDDRNEYKFTNNIHHDSDGDSLFDAEFLSKECGNVISQKCFNPNEDGTILSHDSLELGDNEIKLNRDESNIELDYKSNIPQLEIPNQKLMENKVECDSSLISDVRREINPADPIRISQINGQVSNVSKPSDGKNKLKITTVQYNSEEYEIFSKHQLGKWNNLPAAKETIENDPHETEQFTKHCDLSQRKFKPPNSTVNGEDSLSSWESNRENFIHCPSGNNRSFQGYELPLIGSRRRNLSLNSSFSSFNGRNYDEECKNVIKSELLSEIEQRLNNIPSSQMEKSLHKKTKKLKQSLRENDSNFIRTLIKTKSPIEKTKSLLGDESTNETCSSKIEPQKLDRPVDIENCSPSPKSKPAKRRISEDSSVDNTPISTKQQRLHERSIKKRTELISSERKSPERIACELESIINNESLNTASKELDASKNATKTRKIKPRPKNLEDFVTSEKLIQDKTKAHFRLKNIDDDDEIWIMNLPKTINPTDLQDKTIMLGGKSELKLGDSRYKISSKFSKDICSFSCIFTTSRKNTYKIVNIESKGEIKFRQRFLDIPKLESADRPTSKISSVPFPKNLKTRHPLFGANYKDKI